MKFWIARNKNNSLFLYDYNCKPYKPHPSEVWCCKFDISGAWISDDTFCKQLDESEFSNVKWEDEAPTEVELYENIARKPTTLVAEYVRY